MLIIDTDKFPTFSSYTSSLSLSAKKNYHSAFKKNHDKQYREIDFDPTLVIKYMEIWENQLVHGQQVKWEFGINHLEKLNRNKKLKLFSDGVEAIHFIEKKNGYWLCHAPLFDKLLNDKYIAKFMWFSLIKFSIEQRLGILDLGGGPNDWIQYIKTRDNYPSQKYKWAYVPESAKNNPDQEDEYYLQFLTKKLIKKQRNA